LGEKLKGLEGGETREIHLGLKKLWGGGGGANPSHGKTKRKGVIGERMQKIHSFPKKLKAPMNLLPPIRICRKKSSTAWKGDDGKSPSLTKKIKNLRPFGVANQN